MENFFTTQSLAEHLGIHQTTVYEHVRMNLIPHYRVGRQIRFDKREISEWLNERRMDGKGPQPVRQAV